MSALKAMGVVLPNCRDHITAEDIDFITSVLCADARQLQFLVDLLTDDHARDVILDDTHLLNATQDRPGCLKISCYLYFYLIVRDALCRSGVNDCRLADYVAEVLAEYSQAAHVLARAFEDDPQWVALNPDPDRRRARLPEMFMGAIRLTAAAGGVPERTEGCEAVALWLSPGNDNDLWSILRSGWIRSIRWMLLPPYRTARIKAAVMRSFETRRKELMPGPHWYLMALGVDPAHQGRGYGPMLVLRGAERADRDGLPIYVETETELNEGLYHKLGFTTVDHLSIEKIGIDFSLLVRQPRPAMR